MEEVWSGRGTSAVDYSANKLTPRSNQRQDHQEHCFLPLGIKYNDPSGQAVLEAWTVLLAVRHWAFKFREQKLLLKADSTVALAISKKFLSATPTLWLEAQNMPELTVHHLAGILNSVADHLSNQGLRPNFKESRSGP